MRFSWITDDHAGRTGIRAEPGRYDAIPVLDSLLIDGAPLPTNDDRFAVAATLTFGRYVSGCLELPQPCSPATAAAIARYLAPVTATVGPVTLEPRALPMGTGVCVSLEQDDPFEARPRTAGAQRTFVLRSLRSDRYAGSLAGDTSLDVATNAWLHARPYDRPLEARAALLAIAVLHADSLQIDEIVVRDGGFTSVEVARVRDLLAASRLGFSVL